MSEDNQLDQYHRHEALHTASILMSNIHDFLIEHKYALSGINPRFTQLVNEGFEKIADAYQACNEENEIHTDICTVYEKSTDDVLVLEHNPDCDSKEAEPVLIPVKENTNSAEQPVNNDSIQFGNMEFRLPTDENPELDPKNILVKQEDYVLAGSKALDNVATVNEPLEIIGTLQKDPNEKEEKFLDPIFADEIGKSLIEAELLDFDIAPLIREIAHKASFKPQQVIHAFFADKIKVDELQYEAIIDKLEMNGFIRTEYIFNDIFLEQKHSFSKEEYNTYLDREDNEFYNPITLEKCNKADAISSIEITYHTTHEFYKLALLARKTIVQ